MSTDQLFILCPEKTDKEVKPASQHKETGKLNKGKRKDMMRTDGKKESLPQHS